MSKVTEEQAKAHARTGWDCLAVAAPIQPKVPRGFPLAFEFRVVEASEGGESEQDEMEVEV